MHKCNSNTVKCCKNNKNSVKSVRGNAIYSVFGQKFRICNRCIIYIFYCKSTIYSVNIILSNAKCSVLEAEKTEN